MLEKLVEERSNEIVKLTKDNAKKEIMETELKAIRSQMNPHFLFNSLNSIQNLINKGDTDASNAYLSKFAGLMRMILHNSEKK